MNDIPLGKDQALIIAQIKEILLIAFKKDYSRYDSWLIKPNPLLQNFSPSDLIRNGQADKILCIIQENLKKKNRIDFQER